MSGVSRGPKNGNWKGGRTITSHGYVLIRVGESHPLADSRGYAYEHRVVAQAKTPRPLRRADRVHHDDEDKINNRSGNLIVTRSALEHAIHHRDPDSKYQRKPGGRNRLVKCACGCGTAFRRFDRWGRVRRYVTGHNRHG